MQIGNRILRCSRLRHRVAAARLLTNRGAGTIVRAYSCELGNNCRRPRTLTLQIDLAPAADVDQPRAVPASHSMGGHRAERGNESNKEQEDPSAEGHGAADAYVEGTVVTEPQGW